MAGRVVLGGYHHRGLSHVHFVKMLHVLRHAYHIGLSSLLVAACQVSRWPSLQCLGCSSTLMWP